MGHFTVYNPPVDDKCMLHPPVVEVYLCYAAINKSSSMRRRRYSVSPLIKSTRCPLLQYSVRSFFRVIYCEEDDGGDKYSCIIAFL